MSYARVDPTLLNRHALNANLKEPIIFGLQTIKLID